MGENSHAVPFQDASRDFGMGIQATHLQQLWEYSKRIYHHQGNRGDSGMTHTKLPWHAEGPDMFGDYNIIGPENVLAVGAVVSNLRPAEMTKANADLIITAVNSHDGLLEALEAIEPRIGWRGRGPQADKVYYCEFCEKTHEDDELIPHDKSCPMLLVRAAIKAARP